MKCPNCGHRMDLARFRRLVRSHMKKAAREHYLEEDADPRRWPLAVRISRRIDLLPRLLVEYAAALGTTAHAIAGPSRIRSLVVSRHVFAWFLAECSGLTLQEIGTFISRDHSSVLHARKQVDRLLEVHDVDVKFAVEAIQQIALDIWPPNQ